MKPPVIDLPITQTARRGVYPALFLLSAATLAFEVNLTRLFSVAQFYHFAFMIVSIALLGYGASGAALTIFPALRRINPVGSMGRISLATGITMLLAYWLTNWLPFDSYSMLWDRKQVLILLLHYVALAAPFFFTGLALGLSLTHLTAHAGSVYAVNLLGSAAGCVIALIAPPLLGGEGMVTLSSLLAGLAALSAGWSSHEGLKNLSLKLGVILLVILNTLDLGLRLAGQSGLSIFDLKLSPYKSLSYALQYPGSKVTNSRWNAFSRVDVVQSGGIHSLPGLSYRFLQPLPTMDGLLVDGDDLSPMVLSSTDPAFTAYLPNAVVFQLRPSASKLILEPRGGLDILAAHTLSTGRITIVESNPLIVSLAPVYEDQRIFVHQESERSFLKRWQGQYDVIVLSLAASFHPVQSGAYSLAEDYRYTVESFGQLLAHLSADGILVSTRWLQDPPSEDLRLFALAVTAVEASGADPHQRIVAFRGYNTITVLVKNGAFTSEELATIRNFTTSRAFDLTYAPDIQANETNRFNILSDSRYYQTYLSLLDTQPRQAFYDEYAYDVQPPIDDHPFFGHYFKWAQAPQILAQFGKAWLPFGGGGYFVILALLILALLLAGGLILLPAWLLRYVNKARQEAHSPFLLRNLFYFGLLGLAFLFVEIPLLQRFILYLGNPAYAVTSVLFALLFFSGIGSQCSPRLSLKYALGGLVACILALPVLLPLLFDWTIGLPLSMRIIVTVLALAPTGFLMGIPFPAGLRLLAARQVESEISTPGFTPGADIPWLWAVNGAASVVSPILAALLALSYGFRVVLWVGAICYAAALLTAWVSLRPGVERRRDQ